MQTKFPCRQLLQPNGASISTSKLHRFDQCIQNNNFYFYFSQLCMTCNSYSSRQRQYESSVENVKQQLLMWWKLGIQSARRRSEPPTCTGSAAGWWGIEKGAVSSANVRMLQSDLLWTEPSRACKQARLSLGEWHICKFVSLFMYIMWFRSSIHWIFSSVHIHMVGLYWESLYRFPYCHYCRGVAPNIWELSLKSLKTSCFGGEFCPVLVNCGEVFDFWPRDD